MSWGSSRIVTPLYALSGRCSPSSTTSGPSCAVDRLRGLSEGADDAGRLRDGGAQLIRDCPVDLAARLADRLGEQRQALLHLLGGLLRLLRIRAHGDGKPLRDGLCLRAELLADLLREIEGVDQMLQRRDPAGRAGQSRRKARHASPGRADVVGAVVVVAASGGRAVRTWRVRAAARRIAVVRGARVAVVAVRSWRRRADAGVAHVPAARTERAAVDVRCAWDAVTGRPRRTGAERPARGRAARASLAVARALVTQLSRIGDAVAALLPDARRRAAVTG